MVVSAQEMWTVQFGHRYMNTALEMETIPTMQIKTFILMLEAAVIIMVIRE